MEVQHRWLFNTSVLGVKLQFCKVKYGSLIQIGYLAEVTTDIDLPMPHLQNIKRNSKRKTKEIVTAKQRL